MEAKEYPIVRGVAMDVDEVIAGFNIAICDLAWKLGIENFPRDPQEIKTWDYNGHRAEFEEMWKFILKHPRFWLAIKPLPEVPMFRGIHYVTARPVPSYVTMTWMHLNSIPFADVHTVEPNVSKIRIFKFLKIFHGIKYFLDDKPENFEDARRVFGEGAYLFDVPHNQHYVTDKRIYSIYDLPPFRELAAQEVSSKRSAA